MFWVKRLGSILAAFGGCFLIQQVAYMLPGGEYIQRLVALAGLYVILAVSLNLINGITGQFSIGHAAFYQVGAYVSGFLTVKYYGHIGGLTGLPWLLLMMVIGAIGAGIAGFVVGLPSLRLRGDYLAIVTLGFGEIIRIIVQNVDAVGGSYGLNVHPKFLFIWLVWLLAIFCIATCRNLLKTAHGLPFLAVREDEVAALAMGVNVTRTKVTSFVIASMFAGAAGVLLAHYEGFITPASFYMDVSFMILTMVVLGGTGSITGSVVSAILLSYLPEYLRGLKDAQGQALVVTGASVVAALAATVLYIGLTKKMNEGRLDRVKGGLTYLGALLAALIAKVIFTLIFSLFKPLVDKEFSLGQSFVVIFSKGQAVVVTEASMAGLVAAIIVFVAVVKLFSSGRWDRCKTVFSYLGVLMLSMIAAMVFTPIFSLIKPMAEKQIAMGQLRMVIFATALIVIMLLRPQGIFAHHEFSWDWVKRLFKKQEAAPAVSA